MQNPLFAGYKSPKNAWIAGRLKGSEKNSMLTMILSLTGSNSCRTIGVAAYDC